MSRRKQAALLVSGGLDSAILLQELLKQGRRVYPIYVKSGHRWETAELYWLRRFLKSIQCVNLKPLVCLQLPTSDLYKRHWSQTGRNVPGPQSRDDEVYLPGKNILLIAKTSIYCALKKIPVLILGTLKTNSFPDASPRFFLEMGDAVSRGLHANLRVEVPLRRHTKKEVLILGRDLPLALTFSCLAPKNKRHCGRCNKCIERKKAFRVACLPDPTNYARPNRRG